MKTLDILAYFMLTASATAAGVCYAMAVETIRRKGFKLFWVFVLSLLITPFGAWIVSLVLKEGPPPPAIHSAVSQQREDQPTV